MIVFFSLTLSVVTSLVIGLEGIQAVLFCVLSTIGLSLILDTNTKVKDISTILNPKIRTVKSYV